MLLNRPQQLNALSGELMEELVATLQKLDEDEAVRCIVLGGNERAFAAGADIAELAAGTPVSLYQGRRLEGWDAIRKVRTPVVAAVSGFCLGGGCELAMACDLIVARSEEARDLGLVARVVAQEAWLDAAKRVAREIAAKSPVSVRLAKEAIDEAFETPLSAGIELERRSFYLARASEDADEGLSAFVEKRKPEFRGR